MYTRLIEAEILLALKFSSSNPSSNININININNNNVSNQKSNTANNKYCENCLNILCIPLYGTGRFCSATCARSFSIRRRYKGKKQ